jgi:hypothetical protein
MRFPKPDFSFVHLAHTALADGQNDFIRAEFFQIRAEQIILQVALSLLRLFLSLA